MEKARKVWVICANLDVISSSCIVNSVYLNKKLAEEWVKKQNEEFGIEAYFIEQSQLIK